MRLMRTPPHAASAGASLTSLSTRLYMVRLHDLNAWPGASPGGAPVVASCV